MSKFQKDKSRKPHTSLYDYYINMCHVDKDDSDMT